MSLFDLMLILFLFKELMRKQRKTLSEQEALIFIKIQSLMLNLYMSLAGRMA